MNNCALTKPNSVAIFSSYFARGSTLDSIFYSGITDVSITSIKYKDKLLHSTISNGYTADQSFIFSPKTALFSYALEELHLVPHKSLRTCAKIILLCANQLSPLLGFNRAVCINNSMLTTSLHPLEDDEIIINTTKLHAQNFPKHYICVRSIGSFIDYQLSLKLKKIGYAMIASRNIYICEKPEEQIKHRRDNRKDSKLINSLGLYFKELTNKQDCLDIERLYKALYLDKHCHLNPNYSQNFFWLAHKSGYINIKLLISLDGRIQGFIAYNRTSHTLSIPAMGYDQQIDHAKKLYKILINHAFQEAAKHNLILHLSAGASSFKLSRGATSQIEYTAIYAQHLNILKRTFIHALSYISIHIAAPIMKKFEV
ncbi:hypothetical protein PS914_00701 [Pseudomonas fluorescens]|uniref:hypothetical protein n=1 Tax=Pseudomonas fluorescens TaxID=294 RepID=UPI00123FD4B4|nr:hypothetical protein [Pseudomonas fluorescens]VVP68408.1 hypothetical protein PS914_00701 [Pseudomonas fluorescens]